MGKSGRAQHPRRTSRSDRHATAESVQGHRRGVVRDDLPAPAYHGHPVILVCPSLYTVIASWFGFCKWSNGVGGVHGTIGGSVRGHGSGHHGGGQLDKFGVYALRPTN